MALWATRKMPCFDLMDAVLVSACIMSFVSLSQSPVFRREWSSTYTVLHESQIPRAKVLKLLVKEIPTHTQPVLVGDLSGWNRPAAKNLKDRTMTRGGDSGIRVRHGYSTLAWIPEASGSWALPLRHERLTSFENPCESSCLPTQTSDPATECASIGGV